MCWFQVVPHYSRTAQWTCGRTTDWACLCKAVQSCYETSYLCLFEADWLLSRRSISAASLLCRCCRCSATLARCAVNTYQILSTLFDMHCTCLLLYLSPSRPSIIHALSLTRQDRPCQAPGQPDRRAMHFTIILHIFTFESFDFSISGLWSGFWCSPGPFNCAFQKFPQRRKAINPYMWSYMGIAVALGISVLGEDDLNALDSLDIVDLNSQTHARKDFLHSWSLLWFVLTNILTLCMHVCLHQSQCAMRSHLTWRSSLGYFLDGIQHCRGWHQGTSHQFLSMQVEMSESVL